MKQILEFKLKIFNIKNTKNKKIISTKLNKNISIKEIKIIKIFCYGYKYFNI